MAQQEAAADMMSCPPPVKETAISLATLAHTASLAADYSVIANAMECAR